MKFLLLFSSAYDNLTLQKNLRDYLTPAVRDVHMTREETQCLCIQFKNMSHVTCRTVNVADIAIFSNVLENTERYNYRLRQNTSPLFVSLTGNVLYYILT